jgi:hypothetical protein
MARRVGIARMKKDEAIIYTCAMLLALLLGLGTFFQDTAYFCYVFGSLGATIAFLGCISTNGGEGHKKWEREMGLPSTAAPVFGAATGGYLAGSFFVVVAIAIRAFWNYVKS